MLLRRFYSKKKSSSAYKIYLLGKEMGTIPYPDKYFETENDILGIGKKIYIINSINDYPLRNMESCYEYVRDIEISVFKPEVTMKLGKIKKSARDLPRGFSHVSQFYQQLRK